jgi:hypothetical protein
MGGRIARFFADGGVNKTRPVEAKLYKLQSR